MSKFKGLIKSDKTRRAERARFYRATIIGGVLVLVAFFTVSNARADEVDDIVATAALCAAANGVAYNNLDPGFVKDAIHRQAEWWSFFLEEWVEDKEVSNKLYLAFYKTIADRLNAGELTWDQLMESGKACSAMRIDLGKITEEADNE